jgi:hypothetical protein
MSRFGGAVATGCSFDLIHVYILVEDIEILKRERCTADTHIVPPKMTKIEPARLLIAKGI